ncbi:MAG: tetratricopeptide repeat protein [Planctomycetes bacterium]|nr:tetratricopeptide repeat protein [Planctomycetota bacterium]
MTVSGLDNLEARQRAQKLIALGVLVIVVMTLLAYCRAPFNGFIWDDETYVQNNTLLHDIDGLQRIWIPRQTVQYYPVVFSTFWIEYQLWELNPLGYHITNIILHLLNALLLWGILRTLKFPLAMGWLIAALFAVHPVHVESVAWITERKNVLSGFFYLCSGLAYLRFAAIRDGEIDGKEPKDAWGWYGFSLPLFGMALMSKSVTCSLPAALILIMLWQRKPFSLARILTLLPMFIIGFFAAMNTARIEREVVGAEGADFVFSFIEKCLIASKSLLFYPQKIIWPHPLIFNYSRWDIGGASMMSYWPVAVVALVGMVLVWLFLKGKRGPFIALAFFAGTVFPAIGFFNVYPHRFSFVADHFQYLASIGVIALLVGIGQRLIGNPKRLLACGAVPLVIFSILTWNQNGEYRNLETLWRATLAKNPQAWMPHNNLSSLMLRRADEKLRKGEPADDEIEAARQHAQSAIDIKPTHHTAHANLSEALRLQGRYDEALHHITRAVEERPIWPDHHRNQGRMLELLNNPNAAMDAYRSTIELASNHIPARLNLARLLVSAKELENAAEQYEAVLSLQPDNFTALGTLSNIRNELRQFALADALFDRAMQATSLPQDQIQVAMRYAVFLIQCPDSEIRNPEKAVVIADRICTLTSRRLPNTLDVLAMAHAAAGRFDVAVRIAEEAVNLARRVAPSDMSSEIEARLEDYRNRTLPSLAQPKTD